MGHLVYANSSSYEFDDRVLAHLKVVVSSKLRRHESFYLNWVNEAHTGSGRMTLWISPDVPLAFHFSGSRPVRLDQIWLEVLAQLAHTVRGLTVISEEEAHAMRANAKAEDDGFLTASEGL